jgi:hypothetical protein
VLQLGVDADHSSFHISRFACLPWECDKQKHRTRIFQAGTIDSQTAVTKHHLSTLPILVDSIMHGLQISNMLPVSHTTISKNHRLINTHGSFAHNYVLTETATNCRSGPFDQAKTEAICSCVFHALPYLIVSRPGNTGEPDEL